MAEMGRYCKAYHVRRLREFPGWQPRLENLRADSELVDGEEVTRTRAELDDADILYVQETLVVTDGIFLDENVVWDQVTPEWEAFCRGPLGFEVPEDDLPQPAEAVPAESAA